MASVASASERLIVALDVSSAQEAHGIVDDLKDTVSFYKIGLHLQLDPDLQSLLSRLSNEQKKIFLDFKYIDIPATVEGAIRSTARLGITFTTVMGQRKIIETAVKAKGSSKLKILAVTLLTATTEEEMRNEYNTTLSIQDFIARRARAAADMGCDGVISSPNEVGLIRSVIPRRDFLVVTPGIRPIEAALDDQKRTATPYDAMLNGADYLVVGRPIIQQQDKQQAARRIIDEMKRALAFRERPAAIPEPLSPGSG
jgi:orotidine-5'-phosphate decarboxylase